jgi:hypothetical protein
MRLNASASQNKSPGHNSKESQFFFFANDSPSQVAFEIQSISCSHIMQPDTVSVNENVTVTFLCWFRKIVMHGNVPTEKVVRLTEA